MILQREILASAAEVLKVGGEMVYSTCTILPQENQENAAWFLETHPNFESVALQIPENVAGSYDEWEAFPLTIKKSSGLFLYGQMEEVILRKEGEKFLTKLGRI